MVHPFCCVTPHNGVNIVVLIQTIASIVLIGDSLYSVYSSVKFESEFESTKEIHDVKSAGIGMGITWIIYSLLHVGLAIILWKASQRKCISRSRMWLISTSILLLVHLLLFLISLFCLPDFPGGINTIYFHVPFMLVIAYLLWAVGVYIHEINEKEEEAGPGPTNPVAATCTIQYA